MEDHALIDAAQRKLRSLYLGKRHADLDEQASDTPPLSLASIFNDYLEEFGDAFDKM